MAYLALQKTHRGSYGVMTLAGIPCGYPDSAEYSALNFVVDGAMGCVNLEFDGGTQICKLPPWQPVSMERGGSG